MTQTFSVELACGHWSNRQNREDHKAGRAANSFYCGMCGIQQPVAIENVAQLDPTWPRSFEGWLGRSDGVFRWRCRVCPGRPGSKTAFATDREAASSWASHASSPKHAAELRLKSEITARLG